MQRGRSTTRGLGGFYRRTSSGTWTRLSRPPIDAFALDPVNGNQLYAWSYDEDDSKDRYCAKLYGSDDGGHTWASIGRQLPLVHQHCR